MGGVTVHWLCREHLGSAICCNIWNIGILEQWVINSEFADGELLLPNMSADASLRAQHSIMSANASPRAHHFNCIQWHRWLTFLWGDEFGKSKDTLH